MSLGWLVISRGGCTWALPGATVRQVERDRLQIRLHTDERPLVADRVLGALRDLRVVPAGAAFRELAPEGCLGFAVWDDEPVVVVDPSRPPPVLYEAGEATGRDEENGHEI